MARPAGMYAWKLVAWSSHHEPSREIRGGLSYWIQKVHTGEGRSRMIRKYGMPKTMTAVGLFNILQQRTARLPIEVRGWVLTEDCLPYGYERVSIAQKPPAVHAKNTTSRLLASSLGITETLCTQLMDMLEYGKWLAFKTFTFSGRPTDTQPAPDGRPTKAKAKKTMTKDEDQDPAVAGGSDSESGSSLSPSSPPPRGLLAAELCRALGVNPTKPADRTLICRMVEHHTTADGSPKPSLHDVERIAIRIRSSAGVGNRFSVFQSELQNAGLHYTGNKKQEAMV